MRRETLIALLVLALAAAGAWGFLVLTRPEIPRVPRELAEAPAGIELRKPRKTVAVQQNFELTFRTGTALLNGIPAAEALAGVWDRALTGEFRAPRLRGRFEWDRGAFSLTAPPFALRGRAERKPDGSMEVRFRGTLPASLFDAALSSGQGSGEGSCVLTAENIFRNFDFSGELAAAFAWRGATGRLAGRFERRSGFLRCGRVELTRPASPPLYDLELRSDGGFSFACDSGEAARIWSGLPVAPARPERRRFTARTDGAGGFAGNADKGGFMFSLKPGTARIELADFTMPFACGAVVSGTGLTCERAFAEARSELAAAAATLEAGNHRGMVWRFERPRLSLRRDREFFTCDGFRILPTGEKTPPLLQCGATELAGTFTGKTLQFSGASRAFRARAESVVAEAESVSWEGRSQANTLHVSGAPRGAESIVSGACRWSAEKSSFEATFAPDSLTWSVRVSGAFAIGGLAPTPGATLSFSGSGGRIERVEARGRDFALSGITARSFTIGLTRAGEGFDCRATLDQLECASGSWPRTTVSGVWRNRRAMLRGNAGRDWQMLLDLHTGDAWRLHFTGRLRARAGMKWYLGTLLLGGPFELELAAGSDGGAEVRQSARAALDGGMFRFGDLEFARARGMLELDRVSLARGHAELEGDGFAAGVFRAARAMVAIGFTGTGAYRIDTGSFSIGGSRGELAEKLISSATANLTTPIRLTFGAMPLDVLLARCGLDGSGGGSCEGFAEYRNGRLFRAEFAASGPGTVRLDRAVERSAKDGGARAFAAAALREFHYRTLRLAVSEYPGRREIRCDLAGRSEDKLRFLYDENSGTFLPSSDAADFGDFEISVDFVLPNRR